MEEKMTQEKVDEALNEFFRFYEDGFEETRPMYENIIEALAKSGALRKVKTIIVDKDGEKVEQAARDGVNLVYEEDFAIYNHDGTINVEETLNRVIEECKKNDANPIYEKGKMQEDSIGLTGFFTRTLGYTKKNLGKEDLRKLYSQWGKDGLSELSEKEGEKPERSILEAKAFLAKLATSPFIPRTTMASAAHFMSLGNIMQIACSQGKTTVVAFSTYVQMMMGEKVCSTSSAPGLVPENYDEAKEFYEILGVEEKFCSISQNAKTYEDHIVLFHRGNDKEGNIRDSSEKYEIRDSGKIYIERKEKDSEGKEIRVMYEIKEGKEGLYIENAKSEILNIEAKTLEQIATELGVVVENGEIKFKESVGKMMREKDIIMGDTIILGKYKDLLPKDGDKDLIVDEADVETFDTQPQEILGRQYGKTEKENLINKEKEELEKRWEMRCNARDKVSKLIDNKKGIENITREDLESLVSSELPLDFIVDAYEATKFSKKNLATNEKAYEVKNKKIFVLNPNTNLMQPASQGLAQAIIANDEELRGKHEEFIEYEVIGERDISDLFSEFDRVSLMSGTMQDKGLDKNADPQYIEKRMRFFQKCGTALGSAASKGIMDWKLVTPKTREEKGNVIVTTKGVKYNPNPNKENDEKELTTIGEEKVANWKDYIGNENNKRELEKNWKQAVQEEARRRSKAGQPVMISIYGDRNPMGEDVPIYTAQNQKDSKEMFVDKNGLGEIACFDDFYGRGYTFKFLDERTGEKSDAGGHVLISSLPQNSRNLEQFLFRVARGGDKGSSSIIISPTDPVLLKHLEKLEAEKGEEAANEFFNKVITGELNVDKIVAAIYPEETKAIFDEKRNQLEMKKIFEEYSGDIKASIEVIEEIGKGKISNLSEIFAIQYNKEILKQMKLNRQMGTPASLEEQLISADTVVNNTLKEMIKEHKVNNVSDIVALLPVGLTPEELEVVITDDKLRDEVSNTLKKIDTYIERKHKVQTKEEKSAEMVQTDNERYTATETFRACSQDIEFNLTETEKALAQIRESRMNYREQKTTERKTEENGMEIGG